MNSYNANDFVPWLIAIKLSIAHKTKFGTPSKLFLCNSPKLYLKHFRLISLAVYLASILIVW